MFQGMATIQLALQQLYRQVRDTTIKTGSDAYAIARTIYAATKSPVAGPHLATAAGALGKRYTRKPKATAAAAQPTANAASAPAHTPLPSPSTTAPATPAPPALVSTPSQPHA